MNWFLLIATIPGQAGSLRLRFWRQLRALGAANLRDGVYLLPARENLRPPLEALREELIGAEGNAWLLDLPKQAADLEQEWRGLFDRGEMYREWLRALAAMLGKLADFSAAEAHRLLRQSRKDLEATATIDFFAKDDLIAARSALADAEKRLTRHFSPDEPEPVAGTPTRLDPGAYRGRTWATRKRPWVDRLASAWLIQRFIDPDAVFLWIETPADCPPSAIGFDFDGAVFSHVDDRVSFENLLASFGLADDHALLRIAGIVHFLDVGGLPVPEAAGLEAMLDGMRACLPDDDQLLAAASRSFDFLYESNRNPREKS